MANSGKKKIRKVKGVGTVYYDNRLFQWVGQIESGKYSNGRTKYTRFYADGQNTVIDKMRDYISSHPAVAVLSGNGVESEMTFESYLSAFLATVKKARLKPSKVIIQDSTKTRDHRSVYLTKTAADLFAEMNRSLEHRPDDYVYYSPTSRDVNNALGTYSWICKRAGIENHQGLHTLRHTFASLMIRKGVDIKIVSEMLGHSSVTFTYNTYVHLQEDDKADAIKRLAI